MSVPLKVGGKKKKKELKKSLVDHTYRDYSHADITDLFEHSSGVNEELFPAKLQKILSLPEHESIISWRPHGRAWVVTDKALFISVVLPKYFNHSNFESFNRSVNGWGFKRLVRDGRDRNSYYHELFLRGRSDLTSAMARLINPGKRLPDKESEPDFYDIGRKYPLQDASSSTPRTSAHAKREEIDGGIERERTPSPLFTPPPATKRYKWNHNPPAGTHHPYGYHPRAPIPYSEPPPYAQTQAYYSHRPPPYTQPPPNYAPPHHPHYGGYYHMPPHPGQFYHPPSHAETPQMVLMGAPPYHAQHWGPGSMPPQEWHPSNPLQYYHRPPKVQSPPGQHHKEYRTEERLPVLQSNQNEYAAQSRKVASNAAVQNIYAADPSHATQDNTTRPDQGQSFHAIDHRVQVPPNQFVEGLELSSATMRTWKRNEVEVHDPNVPGLDPTRDQLSMYRHDAYGAAVGEPERSIHHHVVYRAPAAGEQERNAVDERHNPLDIDNFYHPSANPGSNTEMMYPPDRREVTSNEAPM